MTNLMPAPWKSCFHNAHPLIKICQPVCRLACIVIPAWSLLFMPVYFPFHGLERRFYGMERKFRPMECMFQPMERRTCRAEATHFPSSI